jgi:hypothetical protein
MRHSRDTPEITADSIKQIVCVPCGLQSAPHLSIIVWAPHILADAAAVSDLVHIFELGPKVNMLV